MDMNHQTPPEFKKKKSGISPILTIILCIVVALVSGLGSAFVVLKSTSSQNGISIVQQVDSSKNTIEVKDVSDVATKCKPSVVEITTETVATDPFFMQSYAQEGAGSGVIISKDGYIITNNHVIEGAKSIVVRTMDGQEYNAELIGTDSQMDIAVIKVTATDLIPATFGDSDTLKVGNIAIAIGNPLGELGGTVTQGIISATERQITINNEVMTLLQTDAAINPGNSGGGLFDEDGNLIGVVNAKTSSSGIEGLGFAIPINSVIDIIDELIANGSVTSRPALNVSLYDYTKSGGYYYSNNQEAGCYIVQIVSGGAADQAGLKQNDRIVKFDGKSISSTAEVKAILRNHKIGDKVEIVVDRDGEEITKTFELQAPTK